MATTMKQLADKYAAQPTPKRNSGRRKERHPDHTPKRTVAHTRKQTPQSQAQQAALDAINTATRQHKMMYDARKAKGASNKELGNR